MLGIKSDLRNLSFRMHYLICPNARVKGTFAHLGTAHRDEAHIEQGETLMLRYPSSPDAIYPEKIEVYATNGTNSLVGNLSREEAVALLHTFPRPRMTAVAIDRSNHAHRGWRIALHLSFETKDQRSQFIAANLALQTEIPPASESAVVATQSTTASP
jgi:hypothetical protein